MARPLRIQFPGALYHVTSRGNARAPIFLGDSDRHLFLDVLGAAIDRSHWLCHAYCLMTNHYHLVLETPRANLSRGMRQLNGLYTQRFNRRHERVGHIFQGRFTGILVERESHLLELARYVVLNPVRAGMVPAAEDYRWSSLRAALGMAPTPRWLTHRAIQAQFGLRAHYREFVAEGTSSPSPWSALRGTVLGSEEFAARVGEGLEEHLDQGEISRRERFPGREPLEELFRPQGGLRRADRNERIRKAIRTHGYTASEIGRHLGLHYSTIGKIIATRNSRSTLAHQRQPRPSCSALPSGDASNSQFQT
jgi:REP element-mobilizing transposase RayT